MKPYPVKIYTSINSPFGWAFLNEALRHPSLEVVEVVAASVQLWWRFHCRLRAVPTQELPDKIKYRFEKRKQSLIKKLPKNTRLRLINTVNTTGEARQMQFGGLVFCAAFPELIVSSVFGAVQPGIVNFHPSYLPRCRGAHPIYWTIAKREPYGGLSSHFISQKIDGGAIICRQRIPFDPASITYDVLFELVRKSISGVISQTVEQSLAGKTISVSDIEEEATYHHNDRDSDHEVCWNTESFAEISAKIRAGSAYVMGSRQRILLRPPVVSLPEPVDTVRYLVYRADASAEDEKPLMLYQEGMELGFVSRDAIKFTCNMDCTIHSFGQRALLRLAKFFPGWRRRLLQKWANRQLLGDATFVDNSR